MSSSTAPATPVVEVEDLARSYGPVRALQGVSFAVPAGQVVGVLGPNGAGKTTAIKILTGFLGADRGRARVCGLDVEEESLEVRRRLGYLPENNPLYPELLVREFLDFTARARGLAGARRRAAVALAVERTGLAEVYHRPIGECSKGYRQRVGLAQALLHDPPLLVLDEPTSGLDPIQAVEMRALIRELAASKTILLTSHVLPEVEALAERVVVLHRGRKVADGSREELAGEGGGRLGVRIAIRGSQEALAGLLEAAGARLQGFRPHPFGRPELAAAQAEVEGGPEALEAMAAAASAAGLPLVELTPQAGSLEDLFRRLIAEEESWAS